MPLDGSESFTASTKQSDEASEVNEAQQTFRRSSVGTVLLGCFSQSNWDQPFPSSVDNIAKMFH